jgi:hypothetical protein
MSAFDLQDDYPLLDSNAVEDQYTPPDITEIKQLHSKLLTRYIEALNTISVAPRRIKYTDTGVYNPWRYVASLFAESHIKAKLNELSVAYLYLSSSLPIDEPDTKEAREWLRITIDECRKVAETLQSTTNLRGFLTLAWPYLLPVVASLLGVSNPKDSSAWFAAFSPDFFIGILILSYFPIFYAAVIANTTFSYKRSLFLKRKPTMMNELSELESNQVASPENIYYLEDKLFGLLNRGKKRERALDLAAPLLAILMFLIPMMLGIGNLFGTVLFGGGIIGYILYFLFKSRKRKWR